MEGSMALKRKARWLVISAGLGLTALTMLRLWAAVPQDVRSRIASAVQVHARAGNIDKKTLDVYVTNNDTQDWMPVFSRNAKGNVAPDRLLATPHRTWGITADETRQELYMTVQYPSAVTVYRKTAANNDAPLRILEGDATELADPHGIALDLKDDLMIVSNHGHRRFYGGAAVSTTTETWEEWIGKTTADLNTLPRRYLPGVGKFA